MYKRTVVSGIEMARGVVGRVDFSRYRLSTKVQRYYRTQSILHYYYFSFILLSYRLFFPSAYQWIFIFPHEFTTDFM